MEERTTTSDLLSNLKPSSVSGNDAGKADEKQQLRLELEQEREQQHNRKKHHHHHHHKERSKQLQQQEKQLLVQEQVQGRERGDNNKSEQEKFKFNINNREEQRERKAIESNEEEAEVDVEVEAEDELGLASSSSHSLDITLTVPHKPATTNLQKQLNIPDATVLWQSVKFNEPPELPDPCECPSTPQLCFLNSCAQLINAFNEELKDNKQLQALQLKELQQQKNQQQQSKTQENNYNCNVREKDKENRHNSSTGGSKNNEETAASLQQVGSSGPTTVASTAIHQQQVQVQAVPFSIDSWLLGGSLGSKSAILVFRSSALAQASEQYVQQKPAYKLHITYKVIQTETKLLAKLLECHGFTEVQNSSDYNLLWTGAHPKPGILRAMAPYQRINHFPRSFELTRKDRLYKNIEKMQHAKGVKHFDFIPQTFVMPAEYKELCSMHHRIKGPWIVKPVASSRGRGIYIVDSPSHVPIEEQVVVAKYIANPLLIKGHKCDLRLYVVVTSFDPLLIYIYEEGLVRFATVKYDTTMQQLWNPCMHLCNYSINKYHSDYIKSEDPAAENVGHKWTLSALLRHLKELGRDTSVLMGQVEDLVVKTIISSANTIVSACKTFVPHVGNCFELYGFDLLIDDQLKPWLLEVNLSPSLGCDSPLDVRLKSAMLADLLTLVGVPAIDPVLRTTATLNQSLYVHHHNLNGSHEAGNSRNSSTTNSSRMRMKIGSCRRVHSADGLSCSNTLPKKNNSKSNSKDSLSTSSSLSPEDMRMIKMAKAQFDRRGGFVRIFPTSDSWAKYSTYLDPINGVPISGVLSSSSYNLSGTNQHNLNQILYANLFPDVQIGRIEKMTARISGTKAKSIFNQSNSLERDNSLRSNLLNHGGFNYSNNNSSGIFKKNNSITSSVNAITTQNQHAATRQSRYERKSLSHYNRTVLITPKKVLHESQSAELKRQMCEMMKNGRKLSQIEARKTFSQYLTFVLKRITNPQTPDHDGHVEIVLKFLEKASSCLKSKFPVKNPSHKLCIKDRAAIVAKQLNDFIYLYNRETELFGEVLNRPNQVPNKLFQEFLDNARESDLEEVLLLQAVQAPIVQGKQGPSFQGLLKCLPQQQQQQQANNNGSNKSSTNSTTTPTTKKQIQVKSAA